MDCGLNFLFFCVSHQGPGSVGVQPPWNYNDIPETFDDSTDFQVIKVYMFLEKCTCLLCLHIIIIFPSDDFFADNFMRVIKPVLYFFTG